MNKRQVTILWVIAIALGAAVTAVKLSQNKSTGSATQRAAGQTLFESFPASEAATIEIQGATGAVTLAKKDAKWVVVQRDNYPANITFVNDFIRSLSDLKITLGMEAGPSFAPRFGMDETASKPDDRGLTATFKDAAGKEIAKVSLGKNIESGAAPSPMGGSNSVGRYVRNHADESGFYAVSEMFTSVSDEAPRWLDSGFISPEKIKSITLSQVGKTDARMETHPRRRGSGVQARRSHRHRSAGHRRHRPAQEPLLLRPFRRRRACRQGRRARRRGQTHRHHRDLRGLHLHREHHAYQTWHPPAATSPDAAPPAADNYLVTVDVTATLPKERKKEDGEKPEDAKTKDTAFADRLKSLTEKLAKEKAFAGITFEVAKSSVDPLLKERDALITKATPPTAAAPAPGARRPKPPRRHGHPSARHRHHSAHRSRHSADLRATADETPKE